MKKMFKIKQIGACAGMAALMMAGAWLNVACSSDEAIVDEKPIVDNKPTPTENIVKFTATLAPKGDNGSGTRAITVKNQGSANETLEVAWKSGEQIAVRYQTGADTYATTTATVYGEPNADGSANITAPLTSPMDGGSVTFVYPASLVNSTGDDIDADKLLNQHGNLMARTTPNASVDDISTYFDAATGSGTLDVNAGQAVVSSKVTMKNEVCICKFKFSLDDGTSGGTSIGGSQQREFNNLKIYGDNGLVYTITSDRPHDYTTGTRGFRENEEIYVAMLPVSSKTVIFHYEQTVTSGKANYIKYAPNTTLEAGKFYRSLNLTLTKDDYNGVYTFKDLSKGSITAANGDYIYQSNSSVTSNTITIADGATVTLAGVNISATGSAGIICNGTANIILSGANSVTSTANYYPAIQAGPKNTTLTISGTGSLTATGDQYAAGIGSGETGTCGNITISGGTITANGGQYGAGIGSGYGYVGIGNSSTCGDITISGGTIEKAAGGVHAAGIGSGKGGLCGKITISGGSITAQAGYNAAGIGSGPEGKYTSISIVSGITMVMSESGADYVAPIGKGNNDNGSDYVTIDGTTIDGGGNYSPNNWNPSSLPTANTTANGLLNWTLKGRTWTLTPKP